MAAVDAGMQVGALWADELAAHVGQEDNFFHRGMSDWANVKTAARPSKKYSSTACRRERTRLENTVARSCANCDGVAIPTRAGLVAFRYGGVFVAPLLPRNQFVSAYA